MSKPEKKPIGRPPGRAKDSQSTLASVVLRLSKATKGVLDRATQEGQTTQSKFVTSLIELYDSLPDSEKRRVRSGRPESPIKVVARLLARVNAANHSFSRQNWPRCLDDHLALLEVVGDHKELEHWVLYRLG